MKTLIEKFQDYDMSYKSIAIASLTRSTIDIIPLIGYVEQSCLKFDTANTKQIIYSHHSPPNSSNFMPAALAKRFMSLSLDGQYLAISWLPLNLDAKIDPSKMYTIVYKVFSHGISDAYKGSLTSSVPFRTIKCQGGCSFLPDNRLALINDKEICVYDLRIASYSVHDEGDVKKVYSVDLNQDLDDNDVYRSDFYDDIPDLHRSSLSSKERDKKEKHVSFDELEEDDAAKKTKENTSNKASSSSSAREVFYEVNSVLVGETENQGREPTKEQQQEEAITL